LCPFTAVDDAGPVTAIAAAGRAQNALCARELAAIGELYARWAPADDTDRVNWAIDGHESVVAELAAALGISRGRARGRLRYAIALHERLPRVAAAFVSGRIDFRLMAAVVHRIELVQDPDRVAHWPQLHHHTQRCSPLARLGQFNRRDERAKRETTAER
jgi:hypothetical protein